MASEVTELIVSLREGRLTLDQVAAQFRQRSWPESARPAPLNVTEMIARTLEDPDPYDPDSFENVTAAYQGGALSRHEYDTLAEAVAGAVRSQDNSASGDAL